MSTGSVLRLGSKIRAIGFSRFGPPEKVLSFDPILTRNALKDGQLRVKMLSAPLHPADLCRVKGWTPNSSAAAVNDDLLFPSSSSSSSSSSPSSSTAPSAERPWVAGSEGVGEIIEIASSSPLQVGQKVIFRRPVPSFAEEIVVAPADVAPVPAPLLAKLDYAAMLTVAPSAAARLLAEFAPALQPGDVVLHNAASSAVSQALIQLCRAQGLRPVSVLRHGGLSAPDTVERLKAYGAHLVVDEAYVRTPEFARLVSDLPPPKLALDAVGGPCATELARHLGHGGTLVSYGCLSRKPLQLPSSLLVERDLRLRGFSLHRWYRQHGPAAQDQLWGHLASLAAAQQLRLWIEHHRAADFQGALLRTHADIDRKIILDF